ncbi:thiamine pyrophosphate-dependent enzyme [Kribbella deserti]|uniref:Thiamine pyrophosphate-dependent enzyme n=1 Tax=Kribbella deserti TaxID=1926257 RepID=A0ABV6QN38_9ACTN
MTQTGAECLAAGLKLLGVRYAFGVSGGAISFFWSALATAGIDVTHFRHESGAAFAACEASIATEMPVVVFVTSGPGLTNALTGAYAARHEAGRVILVSAHTDAAMHGRQPIQETGPRTFPQSGIFTEGPWFDYAAVVSAADQLPEVLSGLNDAARKPTGLVAHISLSLSSQRQVLPPQASAFRLDSPHAAASAQQNGVFTRASSISHAEEVYERLRDSSWLIWVGGGARGSTDAIRRLASTAGVPTMATPRGKGVIAESDETYIGVTGFAGHLSAVAYLESNRPDYILVLGSGLGDFASGYNRSYEPGVAFIHVDLDSDKHRRAYPAVETVPVVADIGPFCEELADLLDGAPEGSLAGAGVSPFDRRPITATDELIDPRTLMDAVQAVLVDHGIPVMAETGNGLAWAINRLRIDRAAGWRAPAGMVGAMGHFTAGVVGVAIATSQKVAALVGDGSMLMTSEVSTAVHRRAPAIWIVLNDSRYNMCEQGAAVLGLEQVDCSIPRTDFAGLARALGASGLAVSDVAELVPALEWAIRADGPAVVDVRIDPRVPAPTAGRNAGLLKASETAPQRVRMDTGSR